MVLMFSSVERVSEKPEMNSGFSVFYSVVNDVPTMRFWSDYRNDCFERRPAFAKTSSLGRPNLSKPISYCFILDGRIARPLICRVFPRNLDLGRDVNCQSAP